MSPAGRSLGVPAVLRPAATVVVLRDRADDEAEGIEVLLVRRGEAGAFGGLWAFPGGQVEPTDADPGAPGDELAAARRAAVREVAEETGLVLGAADLVPLARWTPPPEAPRRFQTWFFVAELAPDAVGRAPQQVAVDGQELVAHRWLAPREALAAHDRGELALAPPTWLTLWQVGGGDGPPPASARRALETFAGRAPGSFTTRILQVGETRLALWEGDAAYRGGSLDQPGPRQRLWMVPGAWRLEWAP
ncbi:NUDIX hydrolase [Aciditerrimonas ferrireducens]|nr:NUDIX domain-containing protein [Aciditerrimonas ferrireducens]MCK4177352.1 NUDIX domain-containing protein [Aciditerrimonas ferrireducens]